MIYESLIAPSEFPLEERDVKRALLTYDKIKLIEPSDRDVIPANAFMSLQTGIPLFGFYSGPVRPMGKIRNYDEKFSQVIDNLKPAIKQGHVDIISTYNKKESEEVFTLGGVDTGGYPLNIRFVYGLFRRMAENQEFLKSSINYDKKNIISIIENEPHLALEGLSDGGLPVIENEQLSEDKKKILTYVARSRIASFIKYAGFCEQKNLIPIFPSNAYGQIAERVLLNTKSLLNELKEDEFWIHRNRILSLCHEEYLVDDLLDKMTIKEVLDLRTKTWGKQAKAREELFNSISNLSSELAKEDEFYKSAKEKVMEYRKTTSQLEVERKNICYQIKCDIGIGILGGTTSLTGLLSQLESPISSIGVTLAAGGMWALEKSKEYVPILRNLKNQNEELKRGAGLGIHNFYSRLK